MKTEYVVVLYSDTFKKLIVRVEHGVWSDRPVMYYDGSVTYDHPSWFSEETKRVARITMSRIHIQNSLGVEFAGYDREAIQQNAEELI
jgi:hypothetical protein